MMTDQEKNNGAQGEKKRPSLNPFQVLGSVFAAGLGVQSSKNRERDFKQGNFSVFVIAGIALTLVFMGTIFTVVQLVLNNTAG
jgi:hypothetical protein